MRISEFVKQPNEYGFHCDSYVHPEAVATPLGSFSIELAIVASGPKARPCARMLDAIESLRSDFAIGINEIVELTHQQYLMSLCDSSSPPEEPLFEPEDIPTGRGKDELEDLLNGQAIIVNEHEVDEEQFPGRVFMSPAWNRKGCLFFARSPKGWERVLV